MLRTLSQSDIEVQITYTIKPSLIDESLNVLIGYPQNINIECDRNESVIDLRQGMRYIKTRDKSIQVGTSSSLSGFVIQLLEEQLLIPNNIWPYYLSVISIHGTKGIDNKIVEVLSRERVIEIYNTMIKLFEWHKRTICQAISITLNPYIPKLSSNQEECTEFINQLKLNANTKIHELSAKDIATLASKLYEYLVKVSKRKRSAEELLGKVYIMTDHASPITEDPRYLYYILLVALSTEEPNAIIAPLINPIYWYDLGYTVNQEIPKMHKLINLIESGDVKLERVYENAVALKYDERIPLEVIADILNQLGIIPRESILIQCLEEDNCYTSIMEILRTKRNININGLITEGYWSIEKPLTIELGEFRKLKQSIKRVIS